MFKSTLKIALLSTAAVMAASCSSITNGPEHALTVAEQHPISVDSQVVTLTIDVDPSTSELSSVDNSRLTAMAAAYLSNGHGPLTVTAPSGAEQDFDGQELAADVRQALFDAGVPWSSISGATYRTGGESDQLIVSYSHYVATASECGDWSDTRGRDYRNLRSLNYGCATMNNIAAMIADPRDLIEPSSVSPRDAQAAARGIQAYREGDVTVSAIDGEIDAGLSN